MTRTLQEGLYGPGTSKPLKIRNKAWKGQVGAITNKKRPEALYIVFSTWVTPNISLKAKSSFDVDDPEQLAVEVMRQFNSELRLFTRKIASFFSSKHFQTNSVIFNHDFAADRAAVGKPSFLEIELNIDTVNEIDDNGQPTHNPLTGKVETLPFADFVKPVQDSINTILSHDLFKKNKNVTFAVTKRG